MSNWTGRQERPGALQSASQRACWRHLLLGAFVTAALFTVGKSLIGRYLGQAAPSSTYGAAGALMVLMFWVYYSAQIFLFGAELTKAIDGARDPGARKQR